MWGTYKYCIRTYLEGRNCCAIGTESGKNIHLLIYPKILILKSCVPFSMYNIAECQSSGGI
jgi:hypothetical protein